MAHRRIPALPGSHPGWIIGVSGPMLAVDRIPSKDSGNEANSPHGEQSAAQPGGGSGVVIPAPYGLTIHSTHWLNGPNGEAPSAAVLRQQFMEDLRLVLPYVAPPVRASWGAICDWMAWTAWVVLPLVILFLVMRVLLIEAETVLAYLEKKRARVRCTKIRYENDIEAIEESVQSLIGGIQDRKVEVRRVEAQLQTGGHRETAMGRAKRWFAQRLLRWRRHRLKGRISRDERRLVLERNSWDEYATNWIKSKRKSVSYVDWRKSGLAANKGPSESWVRASGIT